MPSTKIDELQLQISSDASKAIDQLGDLANALDKAAGAAGRLSTANGALTDFANGLSRIANMKLDNALDKLEQLSRLDLSNLKDKKINIDVSVSGADRLDRLRYAASQAERDIGRSVTAMGKSLGKDLGMNTAGIESVKTILHDIAHDMANGGDGADGMERLKDAIHESATVSTADLTGMREAYVKFLKDVETLHINPGMMEKDEAAEWKRLGLERLLKRGGQRIDTDVFGMGSAFVSDNSDIIDFFTLPQDAPDQFVFLREKILEAQAALNGFTQTDAVTEKVSQMAEATTDKIREMMEVTTSKHMTDSADKIPLDLDIDQTRFEKQIQDAINKATSKTYNTQPIKLKIDQRQLRDNVEAAFSLIDIAKLPQFAQGFTDVSNAISTMNQTRMKDTGITQFTNSMRRLMSVDTSKFDTTVLNEIVNAVTNLARLGSIDKSLNRFISSLSRLANAGTNTKSTADGLKVLVPRLKEAVITFQKLGTIDGKINQFVAGLASLASAGNKTAITAQNLRALTKEVLVFLKALRNAPQISDNMAMTIQGLGNLAAAGQKAGKALSDVSNAGGKSGVLSKALGAGLKSVINDLKTLLSISLKLGLSGVKALGSFMQRLGLLPSFSSGVDKTALSFTNLLRSILPFYGIRGVFNWLKESAEAGSSIVEIENVINTAFGSLKKGYSDISGYIYRWSKDTIDAFGVSELAAKQYAGRLMSMFNSSGFDITEGMRNSAAKMSVDLIERAGDVASFYDISVDEAMTKFQAGLAGQVRPLRALGINMSVANMEAFALSQGITTSWQSMDQASQMALRYQYILYATQYAEGDFNRTSMSMANQVRLLQLNFQMLSTTMGQGLISAIAPVISWLNALIKRLIQAANAFRVFMWTLFGKPLAAAKGVVDEMAGYLNDASDSASDLGDAGGGASDGLGGAADSAKDLKKQLSLLPFDQLNQLAKDTDSASSGGGSGGGAGGGGVGGLGDLGLTDLGDLGDVDSSPAIEAINRWAARMREAFEKQQWGNLGRIIAEGINAGFQYIYDVLDWEKLKPKIVDGFIVPFQETFNSMMAWIDWDLIGQTFARGLNDIVYTLRAWITGFNWREYGGYFAEGMNSLVNSWDADAFGRLIADKFKMAWDMFGGWVDTFNFSSLGGKLKIMVQSAIDELDPADMGDTLADFLNGISDTILNFFDDGDVISDLTDAFSEFANSFLKKLDSEKLADAIESIKEALKQTLVESFEKINKSELATDIGNVLGALPWGIIAGIIAGKAGAILAANIFGGMVFKSVAKRLITKSVTEALAEAGVGSAAGSGASAGAGAAGAGSTATATGVLGTGMSAASILAGTGIMGGLVAIGIAMRKFADEHGGVEKGANLNTDRSFGTTPTAPKSTNGAGYSTTIQTAPITPSASVATATTKVDQIINTILTGTKDPSFGNLELAKAGLMETPIVQKIMDGLPTANFKDAYKKFTDTKAYNTIKGFGASVSSLFQTWWSRNTDRKNYSSNKGMGASISSLFQTWWPRNTNRTNYSSNKSMNASIGERFSTWWWRNVDRGSYGSSKWMNASIGGTFSTWWWRLIDQDSYPATKKMNAKDTGHFVDYTDMWRELHDKWVDINVSIVKKTSDLGAWIKGVWTSLVEFSWFAKGGLFNSASLIGVGEAGAEAVLPLTNRKTMKMIGNAISNAGGMESSGIDSNLATEIAMKIAPIIMSAVSGQNERPINVNATLYTEDNEVLARAVNRGNKSLDKRYNPVAQYSY